MTPVEKWTAFEGDDRPTHGWWWNMWQEYSQTAPKEVIQFCEENMLGAGVDVGKWESWEESVKAENEGRKKTDPWPPGKSWGVTVDGIDY